MESASSFGSEPPRELERVAALYRHGLPTALGESYDSAFEDVDGWNEIEVLC